MECQHVQQLLAFVGRKHEELDETERGAVQQHLAACPLCAEAAQSDRRLDETLGPLMLDIAVPAGLKQKVLDRLAAPKSSVPWKSGLALAAAIALALGAWVVFHERPLPKITADELGYSFIGEMTADGAEKHLAQRGVIVKLPRNPFDYGYLQQVDVVDFKGQRVARLTFYRFEPGQTAMATVLVVSRKQFNLDDVKDPIIVHDEDGFTSLIYCRGNLSSLGHRPADS